MDLLGLIRRLPEIIAYNKFDDDLSDRLNYSHTVAILIVFAIIVTNRQFSENQIKCWVPAQFTGSYEQYVNQICFITNTYSFDMHETLPDDYNQRHEHELKYYQWTPFILILMAILFYMPHQIWRGFSLRSGVDLKDLIEAAQTYRSANIRHDDKIKLLDYITNWVNNYCANAYRLINIQTKRSLSTRKAKLTCIGHHVFFPIGLYTGNYLMITYIFIKFLYLLNSIGQIFLLNTLLGRNYWYYGIEIIYKYWTQGIGLLYTGTGYFPKVVLCDFTIREPNHPKESHRYTVQCVLPFNLFNQQLFTYLYFWLVILSLFNFISIAKWIYRMSPYNNFNYLHRRLNLHILTDSQNTEVDLRRKFVYQYLKGDGTFMLRLVASNVSDYVCRKIIVELYKVFHKSLNSNTIGRKPLFKPILNYKRDDDDDDHDLEQDDDNKQLDIDIIGEDDKSIDETMATDIPPLPNPRQGKIFVERETLPNLPSDLIGSEKNELQQTDSVSTLTNTTVSHTRLHSSLVPLSKNISRMFEAQVDSSEITSPVYKNVEFDLEPNTIISSTLSSPAVLTIQHLPTSPTMKGPSPYATTYLTTKKRNEHELPYIDDSISSSSTSGRLTSPTVVRQTEKPTTKLASTSLFFRRSHDV
ncbi:unnamed protein product [Rotaria magnacalcarata]|uniref:Innexin n=1 Tax=Rotaria magnacalcarata TaxID=392030 RepID=A0A819AYL2_9BILA|nr:unnamed protein product [Rotaria magnacalcarata]CAF3794907.1 unnamed protein product [Rotaria magnacalcarata]